ncbi:MAG: hypothetical protein ACREOV_14450 [Candidatus Dormibacteraceae bacterium]
MCAAPALPVRGTCVFCDAPLDRHGDPAGLLEYLASRLPDVSVSRSGVLHRGPARRIEFTIGDTAFRAGLRNETLELAPPGSPEEWARRVVRALGVLAPDSRESRSVLSRAGWAWR